MPQKLQWAAKGENTDSKLVFGSQEFCKQLSSFTLVKKMEAVAPARNKDDLTAAIMRSKNLSQVERLYCEINDLEEQNTNKTIAAIAKHACFSQPGTMKKVIGKKGRLDK